jgi:hypothetical protein
MRANVANQPRGFLRRLISLVRWFFGGSQHVVVFLIPYLAIKGLSYGSLFPHHYSLGLPVFLSISIVVA